VRGAHQGTTDRGEYRQAAGVIAEAFNVVVFRWIAATFLLLKLSAYPAAN